MIRIGIADAGRSSDTLGDAQRSPTKANLVATGRGLLWWAAISLAFLVMAGLGPALIQTSVRLGLKEFLLVFTGAALIAAAAFSVGSLLGFLFGIPRTLQQETPPPTASTTDVTDKSTYRQSVNTNLEQISDWLTKILVGVGLTQLTDIPKNMWDLGNSLAVAGNPPFTVALIVNFLICGFFSGYLLTRLFLAGAFYAAENEIGERTAKGYKLTQVGAHAKAVTEYEQALMAVSPSTSKPQKRDIYEKLIFNFLYQDPPEGFTRAIQYAQQYLNEEPNVPSGLIWAYLAAAIGQQFVFEKQRGASGADLEAIRQRALEAIRRALEIYPDVKILLRSLWDPTAVKSPGDDDLEVFKDDPEFRALLI